MCFKNFENACVRVMARVEARRRRRRRGGGKEEEAFEKRNAGNEIYADREEA